MLPLDEVLKSKMTIIYIMRSAGFISEFCSREGKKLLRNPHEIKFCCIQHHANKNFTFHYSRTCVINYINFVRVKTTPLCLDCIITLDITSILIHANLSWKRLTRAVSTLETVIGLSPSLPHHGSYQQPLAHCQPME